MSLERYCHERCIALSPRESAYACARTLEANHIGSVVVYRGGRVVGMVTDRDLALRVVGRRRDPALPIEAIMTLLPATASVDDDVEDVLELMRDLGIRRLPLLDGDRLVGMVTVDDLLVSRDVPVERIADVVEAQLAEPAPRKPRGPLYPVRARRAEERDRDARHRSRQERTLRSFVGRLCTLLEVENRDDALRAFELFAAALVRRLNRHEAETFLAQLPSLIREPLLDLPSGPDRSVTPDKLAREMAQRLDLDVEHAAELIPRLGAALGHLIDEGDLTHVRDQLPQDWKSLLGSSQAPH